MAKIINPSILPLDLPTGHVVPGYGELVTTNDVIRGDNAAMLKGLAGSRQITLEMDPDPELPPEAESWTEVRSPFLPPMEQPVPDNAKPQAEAAPGDTPAAEAAMTYPEKLAEPDVALPVLTLDAPLTYTLKGA